MCDLNGAILSRFTQYDQFEICAIRTSRVGRSCGLTIKLAPMKRKAPIVGLRLLERNGTMQLLRLLVVMFTLIPAICCADSWPQWMGPHRDNVWREGGLIEKFPEGGPHVAWRVPVAGGYAGPAVTADRVFVCDYMSESNVKVDNFDGKAFTGTERVQCLDEKTGKQKWHYDYPVKYTISYPAGPRCTPIVDGDKLYTLGAEGDLICFKADS